MERKVIVTACAGGTHSIGEVYRMIKNGYEDAILTGGTIRKRDSNMQSL